jgi:hypothetical protein
MNTRASAAAVALSAGIVGIGGVAALALEDDETATLAVELADFDRDDAGDEDDDPAFWRRAIDNAVSAFSSTIDVETKIVGSITAVSIDDGGLVVTMNGERFRVAPDLELYGLNGDVVVAAEWFEARGASEHEPLYVETTVVDRWIVSLLAQ